MHTVIPRISIKAQNLLGLPFKKKKICSVKPQFINFSLKKTQYINTGCGSTLQHRIPTAYTMENWKPNNWNWRRLRIGIRTQNQLDDTTIHRHRQQIEQHEIPIEIRGQTKQSEPVSTTRTHQACNLYLLGQSCCD